MSSLLEQASLVLVPSGYKEGKVYSEITTNDNGDLDFTRASNATRVNSAGLIETVTTGVPRLDYSQGSCPSLLLEPQRTNLLIRSNELTTSPWGVGNNPIVTNLPQEITPLGVGAFLLESTSAGSRVQQSSFYNNNLQSVSVFVKGNNANAQFSLGVSAFGGRLDIEFDTNNNLTFQSVLNGTYKIQEFNNGWYRLEFSLNPLVTTNSFIQLIINSGSLKVCHAQAEIGAYPTSYIPTLGTSVTRVADAASKTGISDLIGQTEGTLFVEFDFQPTGVGQSVAISDGTSSNRLDIRLSTGNIPSFVVVDGGVVKVSMGSAVTMTQGQRVKVAAAYKNNDFVLYQNGALVASRTSGTIGGTLSRYGFDLNAGQFFNSPVSQALLFKTRLSNTELAQLTTL
jgi:hypothetical protein